MDRTCGKILLNVNGKGGIFLIGSQQSRLHGKQYVQIRNTYKSVSMRRRSEALQISQISKAVNAIDAISGPIDSIGHHKDGVIESINGRLRQNIQKFKK